jgi:hypothetical protein
MYRVSRKFTIVGKNKKGKALLLVPLNQYTSVGYAEASSGCSVDLPQYFLKKQHRH